VTIIPESYKLMSINEFKTIGKEEMIKFTTKQRKKFE